MAKQVRSVEGQARLAGATDTAQLSTARDYRELVRVSMSDLRAKAGEIVDQVLRSGQVILIERKGQPLACLVPVEDVMPAVPAARWARELYEMEEAGEVYSVSLSAQREFVVRVHERPGESGAAIEVLLPHRYPSVPPRVTAAPIDASAPHRFPDGTLCVFGRSTSWNPGQHGVVSAIAMTRQWLGNYQEWRRTGKWPAPIA